MGFHKGIGTNFGGTSKKKHPLLYTKIQKDHVLVGIEGEVLGIRFDTQSLSWSLSPNKSYFLVSNILELANSNTNAPSFDLLLRVYGKINSDLFWSPMIGMSRMILKLSQMISK